MRPGAPESRRKWCRKNGSFVSLFPRRRGPDHVRAAGFGDLRRQVPNAAGGSQHEDAVAGTDLRGVDERLPRSQAGERQRRGMMVIERRRQMREVS